MALFNPRVKTPLHIVYIILVVTAMGLSVPRLFMKGQPRTRANTIALGMVWLQRYNPHQQRCGTNTDIGRQIPHLHRIPDIHRARPSSPSLAELQSLLDSECSRDGFLGSGGLSSHASQPFSMRWDWLQAELGGDGVGYCAQVCLHHEFWCTGCVLSCITC